MCKDNEKAATSMEKSKDAKSLSFRFKPEKEEQKLGTFTAQVTCDGNRVDDESNRSDATSTTNGRSCHLTH